MAEKLVTLNVEGDRHLDRFLAVLRELQPSIVCLQELFEVDVPRVVQELGMSEYRYVPTMMITEENRVQFPLKGNWGVALLTKLQVKSWEVFYYSQSSELRVFVEPNDSIRAVIVATLSDGVDEYRVATTHFTWSPDGKPSELQRQDFARLKAILAQYPELILCGDFNAPRGGEMFSLFEQLYTDNVPQDVTTTIDNEWHYAKKDLQLVVDTIFSTPAYRVSNVQMLSGISDHLGVYGEVEKT